MSLQLNFMKKLIRLVFILSFLGMSTACVSTVVGEAVDLTIEVVKVPFKVAGAAVDVITGDDD